MTNACWNVYEKIVKPLVETYFGDASIESGV